LRFVLPFALCLLSALNLSCNDKNKPPWRPPSSNYYEGLVFNLGGNVTFFDPGDLNVVDVDTLHSWVVVGAQVWKGNNEIVVADATTWRLAVLQLPEFELLTETYLGGAPQDVTSLPDMSHIFAVTANGNFWNYDQTTGTLDTLEVKLHPRRLALRPPAFDQAWVVCAGNNMLHIFDVTTMELVDTLSFELPPCAIAFRPDGLQVYIALTGNPGRLVTLECDSLQHVSDFTVGAGPFELDVSADGRYLAISDSLTGVLTFQDLESRRSWDFYAGGQLGRVRFSEPTQSCYVVSLRNSCVTRFKFGPDGPLPFDTLCTPETASELVIWDAAE
jgi:DNA-binding beta-propeller fold protein YncE